MSFFKYHNYNTSNAKINFTHRDSGNVFNVGGIEKSGVVTVLKENGKLLWSKRYSNPDREVSFKKIISVSGNYVILGLEDEVIPFLLCINIKGDVIWYRNFPANPTQEDALFVETYGGLIYLAFFDLKYQNNYITAVKNDAGDIVVSKNIVDTFHSRSIQISGLAIHNGNIYICGNEDGLGVVINTNLDFTTTTSRYTYHSNGANVSLDGIYYQNNRIYASGVWNNGPALVLPDQNVGYFYKPNTGLKTRFSFGQNNFYLCNEKSQIACSNYNHSIEFIKQLDVTTSVIDKVDGDTILIHGNADSHEYSGFIQGDITNCKSFPMQVWQPNLNNMNMKGATYNFKDIYLDINTNDLKVATTSYTNMSICDGDGSGVDFDEFSGLQTPNFYLQAAGSKGVDSSKGIHLRWGFGGKLGENHLPKGDLASSDYNFNKPEDFVKIYRTAYKKAVFTLDFNTPPQLVDDNQKMWVYKFNNNKRIFYVYFKNKTKYAQVRQAVDPLVDPLKFINVYGYELIEILCKTDIFFAAEMKVNDQQQDAVIEMEALSVAEQNIPSQQHLAYRTNLYGNEVSETYFNAENAKTLRFRFNKCIVSAIKFEFYSDFIISRNQANAWTELGQFSLTSEQDEAFTRLDPLPKDNPVHGAWLRYNDDAYVNTENYKRKWEHQSQGPLDRDIQSVIKKYVELSDNQSNPKANETISINLSPTGSQQVVDINTNLPEQGDMQVSNLDILNIAALDYHVARMLGLGHLDINNDVFGNEFIYIAEYYTNQNLDINTSDKTYQLLSMSLPVSTEIERLSLPVKLLKLNKGMDSDNPQSAGLYDSEGYSHNGKYRYISIYNLQIPELEMNPSFFGSSQKFDASSFTFPVYGGLEYRVVEPGNTDDYIWMKPELCHDTKYLNIDNTPNAANSFETLPIQIPDTYVPLYMHKQDKSGTYFYKGYGINWFSRAQTGGEELSIDTKIKPNNRLLPPTATTAFLIQKEYPVTLTSQSEQDRRQAITDTDKTLVRLGFDHHIYQDEIVYPISFDSTLPDDYYLDPNTIFPDDKEVMADEVEIFYRNYTMKEISAKVVHIDHHQNNQLLAVIKTEDYVLPSSGGTFVSNPNAPAPQPSIPQNTLKSEIPAGTTINDFIGGIFLLDGESYIINGIEVESTGLKFTVFKKAPSAAIISGTSPVIDQSSLVLPAFSPGTEGLFSATENMQNTPTWGVKNPNSLKVKIGTNDWGIHREVISTQQSDGSVQRFVEKSRGFWKNAQVHRHYEKIAKYQNSLGDVIDDPAQDKKVHQGVYKITFPGFKLGHHPQFWDNSNSVEWFNGIVRMFTYEHFGAAPSDSRSIFKVVRTENIGTTNDLVLYVYDESFKINEDSQTHKPLFVFDDGNDFPMKMSDPLMGNDVKINYYPSYRVYLYKNEANNLIEDAILPPANEDVKYSIFGFKSVDNDNVDMQGVKYKSKFSVPAVMFANRIVEPEQPEKPIGSTYATRPDKFGKSTYSFITNYIHKPYSVQFFKANNTVLLAALYEPETIKSIKIGLEYVGGTEEAFFNNRWMNFVDFDFLTSKTSEYYQLLPPKGLAKFRMPTPNSKIFFDAINLFIEGHNHHFGLLDGQANYCQPLIEADRGNKKFNDIIIKEIPGVSGELRFGHFIKEAITNCFLPLTEVPIIYQQIEKFDFSSLAGHRPKNKKQNIRDASGYLLPTTDPDFDMAPMAAIYSETPKHSTLFTDFTLDGASDNFYFYGVRELGNQMQMGEFSKFQGPIKLVNTNPAEPPKILSLLPVVDNATLGISAKVRIEVNSYTDVHKINEISIYRATNKLDADSILSMKHIKTVNIADIEVNPENGSWTVYDEFEDLDEKPYGDALFYRVVASRKVQYSTTDYNVVPPAIKEVQEQAPSLPSKTTVTMLVENYNPPAPVLRYHSEPVDSDMINWVILSWDQICYKGKYHLYKMSPLGNWKEIARIDTDEKDTSKAKLYVFGNNPATNTEEWFFKETFDMTGNEFFLPVEKLGLDPMKIKDEEGRILYHHFKMVSQNTSNMFSTEEKILTIYKEETWTDIGGISHDGTDGMILQGTFIVRPN